MTPGLIPFHPLADLFPLIEGAEFDALCEDVRQNGLRHPIQIWNGQIIDGRNRYRALQAMGLVELGPAWVDDVSHIHERLLPAHVVSLNLRRRHLDETQRALIAAKLADMPAGRPKQKAAGNAVNLPGFEETAGASVATDDAAALLNVSPRSVRTAKAVLREAPPEVLSEAEQGKASLHAVQTGLAAAKAALRQRGEDISPDALSHAYRLLQENARAAKAARLERKKAHRAAREQQLAGRIAAANAELQAASRRYGVILADPEWPWDTWGEGGRDRCPENHYPTSPTDVIAARPVGNIAADDCVLFLWATGPRLPDALAVMAAWGFAYKSHAVWDKGEIGTGYWFRSRHELLLVGVRGHVPCPAMGDQWESIIAAEGGAHSEKPDRFLELIEAYFPNIPKIELNARRARPGWDMWGAEAPEGNEPCQA